MRPDADAVAVEGQEPGHRQGAGPVARGRAGLLHPGEGAPPAGRVEEGRGGVQRVGGQPVPGPGGEPPAVVVADRARHTAGHVVPDGDEQDPGRRRAGTAAGTPRPCRPVPAEPGSGSARTPSARHRRRSGEEYCSTDGRPSVLPAPTTIRHSSPVPPDERVADVGEPLVRAPARGSPARGVGGPAPPAGVALGQRDPAHARVVGQDAGVDDHRHAASTTTEPDQQPVSCGPGSSAVRGSRQRTRSGELTCPQRQAGAHTGASGLNW